MEREQAMKPRVLVVEDDAVSRAFFVEVLSGLPLAVEAVGRCDDALARAAAHAHALWLVDARLPDGDAVALLLHLATGAQDNLRWIALFLPVHAAFLLAWRPAPPVRA